MSAVDTEFIEELLQEQDLDCEDVFCPEGGCFQVIDIKGGKTDEYDHYLCLSRMHLSN